MRTLIIEVSGGVVQEVYSDVPDLRVIKIDWDAGESPGDEFTGGALPVQSLDQLPESTSQALASVTR
jgi:hypothetical protein